MSQRSFKNSNVLFDGEGVVAFSNSSRYLFWLMKCWLKLFLFYCVTMLLHRKTLSSH